MRDLLKAICTVVVCLAACTPTPSERPLDPAQALSRSIIVIRTATPAHPHVLKVLFYGQSITSPAWTDQAVERLRRIYPNVRFDVRNLAIGGFSAKDLERTTTRDLESFYPDLIVFHVYGDHNAYERIIRLFRSKTAADVVIQTDHIAEPMEPLCDEGLHLAYAAPPGCIGHFWFKQHAWGEHMSGVVVPRIARTYDVAIDPRRQRWNAYLTTHGLQPPALLSDEVHPNSEGWRLAADLFTQWFESVVASSDGAPSDGVQSFAPPAPGTAARYAFNGNRIELVATGPMEGHVTADIDGHKSSDLDGCWQNTRTTMIPTAPDWPVLRRVTIAPSYHQRDQWTVRVGNVDAGRNRFEFSVRSAAGGADGTGYSDVDYRSPSGRVAIASIDWLQGPVAKLASAAPGGFEFGWARTFACSDQPPVPLDPGRVEQRFVVATGLENGAHQAVITLSRDAPEVTEIRVYRPPLKE